MKIVLRALVLGALLAAFTVQAATAPDQLVRTTISEILPLIKDTKDRRALLEIAEKKVLPHFDFRRMTMLATGRPWRDATPDQRTRLENAFRALLVNTYVTALSQTAVTDAKVDVKPVQIRPEENDVTVRSVATASGRQPVAVDYRMARTPDGWKVYDVVVENLSLVTNYRSSFASEIERSGIDGLIKIIEARNQTLAER
jgi:phospholipid transport system substrate-binding protein